MNGTDSGTPIVSGDSGAPASDDGGGAAPDGSTGNGDTGNSSGCGCVVAGAGERSQAGALGGILLGLVAFGRRRRSRR
jgi:MYXO-CTERM domain-containing protein